MTVEPINGIGSISSFSNPITPFVLARTLLFQLGFLGIGLLVTYLWVIPYLKERSGVHKITIDERISIQSNPILSKWFKNPKRWFDHPISMMLYYCLWGISVILLTATLYILCTDVGWLDAYDQYGLTPMMFLMARASGQPNGAHLLSYLPLPFLGLFVALKYRDGLFIDSFQGILVVAFGVAIHELIWMSGYVGVYYQAENLSLLPNVIEDIGFSTMCVLFVYTFIKYKYRTIKIRRLILPIFIYTFYIFGWVFAGLPITTINNYQLGNGPFMTTQYWANPMVNLIEIISWVLVAFLFWVFISES